MNHLIKKLLIIIIPIFTINQANAQCNVEKGRLNNGNTFFAHAKEAIFENEDLERGILTAWVRLVVIQSSTDKDLLQFTMLIDVGRSGSKQMVVPRKISIQFTDDSNIDLVAESMQAPTQRESVFFEHSTFRLRADSYTTLQKKSLQKITIIDNRENRELICQPYEDILLEQANCIASEL